MFTAVWHCPTVNSHMHSARAMQHLQPTLPAELLCVACDTRNIALCWLCVCPAAKKGMVTGASGATGTVALVHPQRAIFASLGDSLAVLCRCGMQHKQQGGKGYNVLLLIEVQTQATAWSSADTGPHACITTPSWDSVSLEVAAAC